jgi:hypothetical protein
VEASPGGTSATGGARATGGSGPSDGGSSGSGNVGGSGGGAPSAEAGPDVSAPDATVAEAGPDVAVDASTDGGMLVCTDDGGVASEAGDAGALGQWRDFAAGVCRPCPGTDLECDHLLGPPVPTFDVATSTLTMHLAAGTAEIVSADFRASYVGTSPDGGTARGTASTSATVRGNTITVDLSGEIPAGTRELSFGVFTVTDACGNSSRNGDDSGATVVTLTPTDAGGATTTCYAAD